MKNKFIFWFILVANLILAFELFSWAFFVLYAKDRLVYHAHVEESEFVKKIADPGFSVTKRELFSPRMGWDEAAGRVTDANSLITGGRENPYKSDKVKISTYGDSFTYCEDVNENETWQYYLSESSHTKVINFGVRGYGPDQALLKMMQHLESGIKTDVVILSILSENISRVVNVNTKFYWSVGDYGGFKPVLVKEGSGYKWKDSYLGDIDSGEGRAKAIAMVQKYDYWYKVNKDRPTIKFPYSLSLLRVADYLLFKVKRWPDLWKEAPPANVMRELVNIFYSLSQKYKFKPVLVFIPDSYDLKRKEKGKAQSYARFIESLRSDFGDKGMVIVDILDEDLDAPLFNVMPYAGHASAYGNKAIAKAIYEKIKNKLD